MGEPNKAVPVWHLTVLPAFDNEWITATNARDGQPLAVIYRYCAGDFRIGTFGLQRTPALDRSYADLETARAAAGAWIEDLYPDAPQADAHPGLTDDDIPF